MKDKLTAKQHMERLRDALRAKRNRTDASLIDRLERCFADGTSRYRCRSPACVRCRFINIRHQQRGTFEWLGHFPEEKLFWVTVVLGATSDIRGVSTIIEKSRRDTKNRFDAARSRDSRWNDTSLRAWHEVDAVGAEQVPLLPPERMSLVPALAPMAASTLTPTWLPTWHGILWAHDLSLDEITQEFRRQWPLDNQIDVADLDPDKTLKANLDDMTSYANKFHCSTTLLDGFQDHWPVHWQTQFFGWLHDGRRNAFEGLRMTIYPGYPKGEIEVCKAVESVSPMPFLHSFSGVPMHYNTGAWG